MNEYTGQLPKHVMAQIQEHTGGGYILFRIGSENEIITDLAFDNETAYLALVKKASSILKALGTIDDLKALQSLGSGMNVNVGDFEEGDFEEEEEPEDDDEEFDEDYEDEN